MNSRQSPAHHPSLHIAQRELDKLRKPTIVDGRCKLITDREPVFIDATGCAKPSKVIEL